MVSNNSYAGWCTVAVFFGLIIEYTILLWPKWQELKRWEKVFTVLAGIAIAGGVYGEYFFGSRAADAALEIETISENHIADLKTETSGNELRTAELEHDNLELKTLIQVRDLTVGQQKSIGDALKQFSGKFVLVRTYAYDQEAMRLSELITAALKSANIEFQFSPTPAPGWLNLPIGVMVAGTNKPFVSKLKTAFSSEGKLALTDPNWKPQLAGGIFSGAIMPKMPDAEIFVGVKPLDILGGALSLAQGVEQYAAWRTISDEQKRVILKHLGTTLNGHKIAIFRFADDSEVVSFTDRLSEVLSKAMLVTEAPWPGKGITTPPGMTFFIGKEREADFALIVEALDLAGVAQASVLRKTAQHGIRVADNDLLINVGGLH